MIFDIKKEDSPVLLSDFLRKKGAAFPQPCGGAGTCGKCRVTTLTGNFSAPSSQEQLLLTAEERTAGIRLACCCQALDEGQIELEEQTLHSLTHGDAGTYLLRPPCPLGKGLAIDIGTTTLAYSLFDLETGTQLAAFGEGNRQTAFGSDVISRITYASTNGTKPLTAAIQKQIKTVLKQVQPVSYLVITGNTVMLHFLQELSTEGLAMYPFHPESLFGTTVDFDGIPMYLPPCVSPFVGADITCAILASGMTLKNQTALLCDVGTNGEMALLHNGTLLCCSVSAGPAFEGAEISCGMNAASGAINKVFLDGYKLAYETIDNAPAKGICGSGLIDTAAFMLQNRILDEAGRILEQGHRFPHLIIKKQGQLAFALGNSGIYLTQQDIRQLQMAKSAVRAGIELLLKKTGISSPEVFYLCGGFGSYLNLKNAALIGLFPKEFLGITALLGNAALMGAQMLLLDQEAQQTCKEIVSRAQTLSLSQDHRFSQLYLDYMNF